MAEDKPAFTKGYGEAKEDKMSAQAERERQEVGLSPEEVREINQSKPQGRLTRRDLVGKGVNVLAAGFTAAAGVGLVATAQDALKNTPSPIIREAPEQDPLNRKPPEGVVLASQGDALQNLQKSRDGSTGSLRGAPQPDAPVVEAPPSDAPVEPVYTNRVFAPFISREAPRPETKEENTPLWPDRFGEFAPYNFEVVNMGRRAGVEIMDQELFDNLISKMRAWAIAPEVPRRVVVYEDYIQLNNESRIRRPNPPLVRTNSENSLLGPYEWRVAKLSDGSLQMDISICTIKDPSRLDEWALYAGAGITEGILSFLFSDKEGNYQGRDRLNLNYRRDGEFPIYKTNENNNLTAAPFRAKYVGP